MSEGTSADPEALREFSIQSRMRTDSLSEATNTGIGAYQSFKDFPNEVPVGGGEIETSPFLHVTDSYRLSDFTELVRDAVITADAYLGTGTGPVPNAVMDALMWEGAAARGIDMASLYQGARTCSPPYVGSIPPMSGWVNDPVCSATGHFALWGRDFVMPDNLAIVAWPRWYSSRLQEPGPLGPGWWSWASTSCRPLGPSRLYVGPEGTAAMTSPAAERPSNLAGLRRMTELDDGRIVFVWAPPSLHAFQTWTYGPEGRPLAVDDPKGGATAFTHEADRLVRVRHEGGRQIDLRWDEDRIVRIDSSDGRAVSYAYDQGFLVAVDGATPERFELDGSGRIAACTDADGVRVVENVYDDDGRVLEQVTATGRRTTFGYESGLRTTVRDESGAVEAVFDHDVAGRLLSVQRGQLRTRTTWADDGFVATQSFADGTSFERRSEPQDGGGRVDVLTFSDGTVERFTYDDEDRLVAHEGRGPALEFEYDDASVLPSRILGPAGFRLELSWSGGLPASIVDADGVRSDLVVDAEGVVSEVRLGSDPPSRVERSTSGLPARVEYPDGGTIAMSWDDAGRLLSVTDRVGATATVAYTAAGRLVALETPDAARLQITWGADGLPTTLVLPEGETVRLEHDDQARLCVAERAGRRFELGCDDMHDLTSVVVSGQERLLVERVPTGEVTGVTDGAGRTWRRSDVDGGTAWSEPLGGTTTVQVSADGRARTTTDALGGVTREELDEFGRVSSRVDADGVVSRFVYSPAGRLLSQEVDGSTTSFEYDEGGRTSAIVVDGHRGTIERNSCGLVTAFITATGLRQAIGYDEASRPVSVPLGGSEVGLAYDEMGRLREVVDATGRTSTYEWGPSGAVQSATDGLGSVTRVVTGADGLLSAIVDASGGEVRLEHDAAGYTSAFADQLDRRTEILRDGSGLPVGARASDGSTVAIERDGDGQIVAVESGSGSLQIGRDPLGRAVAFRSGDLDQQRSFTPGGRLEREVVDGIEAVWTHRPGAVERSTGSHTRAETWLAEQRRAEVVDDRLGSVALQMDEDGRRSRLTGVGVDVRWRRDAAGRLVATEVDGGSAPWSSVRERDEAGRIIRQRVGDTEVELAYDQAGQIITATGADGATTWRYDLCGRLVQEEGPDGARSFEYDAAHQLVRSVGPDGETAYEYDAWGRRVREVGPRGTTVYRWDVVGRLVGIDDEGRSLLVEVDLDGLPRRVGAVPVDWDVSGPVPRLVGVGDVPVLQLADVTGYVGSGGEIQWYVPRSQDVWGTTFGPALAADVSLHPFGGLGVGRLVYLGDRVYDPQTRQFLTRDPLPGVLGAAASQVPYAYANNDPVNLVDPTGRRPLSRDEFDEIQDRYTGVQWGNVAYAAAIIGGTILVAVTLGAAAGPLALAVAGAAVGGGSRLIQGAVNAGTHKGSGKVEWGDVLKDTAVGFLAGGAGGYIGKAVGPAGEAVFGTGTGGRVITGGAEGTIDGVTSGVIGETYDGVGLPGGDGRFDPDAVVINGVVGGVGGAGKGAIPTKPLDGHGSGHGHGGGGHGRGSSRAPIEPEYTTGGKVGQGAIDSFGDLLAGGLTGG